MNEYLSSSRASKNLHTPESLVQAIGSDNTVLDPYSILIGKNIKIGKGNVFYPNVSIEQSGNGAISIGDNNVFYPGTFIFCDNGTVSIGGANEFGPAGCTIKANTPSSNIQIENNGRYCDGASILGETKLGSGSQILGSITTQSCTLASGESYSTPDPDTRGAVLKGFGVARGITLQRGEVVNGMGDFKKAMIEKQSFYHPKKTTP